MTIILKQLDHIFLFVYSTYFMESFYNILSYITESYNITREIRGKYILK